MYFSSLLESGMPLVDNHDELLHVVSVTKQDDLQTVFNIQVKGLRRIMLVSLALGCIMPSVVTLRANTVPLDKQWFDVNGDAHWVNPTTGAYEKIPDGVTLSVDHVLPKRNWKDGRIW